MKYFLLLLAVIAASAVGFGFTVAPSATFLGFPIVVLGADGEIGWLTVGIGAGAVVVGGGAGLVCIGMFGAGLLFATGQGAVGLIAIAQVGIGLLFFLGQVGVGFAALGQGVGGALPVGQGRASPEGKIFLKELNIKLNALLRPKRS